MPFDPAIFAGKDAQMWAMLSAGDKESVLNYGILATINDERRRLGMTPRYGPMPLVGLVPESFYGAYLAELVMLQMGAHAIEPQTTQTFAALPMPVKLAVEAEFFATRNLTCAVERVASGLCKKFPAPVTVVTSDCYKMRFMEGARTAPLSCGSYLAAALYILNDIVTEIQSK